MDNLFLGDDWIIHHIFTRVIFDSLLIDIVRGEYNIDQPVHVTLQVNHNEAILFIWETDRSRVIQDADTLYDWALNFIAADVLDTAPDDIDLMYLDAVVGEADPYIYVRSGDDVILSSGEPIRKGLYM